MSPPIPTHYPIVSGLFALNAWMLGVLISYAAPYVGEAGPNPLLTFWNIATGVCYVGWAVGMLKHDAQLARFWLWEYRFMYLKPHLPYATTAVQLILIGLSLVQGAALIIFGVGQALFGLVMRDEGWAGILALLWPLLAMVAAGMAPWMLLTRHLFNRRMFNDMQNHRSCERE